MAENLSQQLEPIAAWFRSLNIPEPITHWGHPVMMATVILVMGGYAVYAGWRGRLSSDTEVRAKNLGMHRQLMPWVFIFLALGSVGGVLSLVMQQKPITESPHFWTAGAVLFLLASNGAIAATGFDSQQKELLRGIHAYLGLAIAILLLVHGIFGLKLGLSI
ncbi:conserved hypothetical protein [Gloeothece citriformis PCC 7424]|uniref:DUF4079 domain-containing protein n=1 Tax=Gloeothece citriformis (strain PCC 7424) TaxID=65393 RepID=B7K9R5_GLOC7|nr:DUF4079 domain-containing protein [Gloeothece citriformis]ACK70033.1 conserved hypothetical protein [Gloeothece citriformis PCC 7424]